MGKRLARSTKALREELEPSMARAFRASARDLADNVDLPRLRKAIERGDIEGAVRACNIDNSWVPLQEEIERQFKVGGKMTTAIIAEEAGKALRGR